MKLAFEITKTGEGLFAYTEGSAHELEEAIDRLLERYDANELSEQGLLTALKRLMKSAPEFLDLHAHIASILDLEEKPKKALEAALLGLSVANQVIPEDFSGRIEWGCLENRSYLQLMRVAVTSYSELGRHNDAVALIEVMLQRNPNDNQGMRYVLGSELLRAGAGEQARAVFENHADYPPYHYELALYHIMQDDWIAAATALRRGFVTNPYIAEIISGNSNPLPLAVWHGTNLAEPSTAEEYFSFFGALWVEYPESVFFVRWLFNHPKVLAERAGVLECEEALLWERDNGPRSRLLNRRDELIDRIDDTLSASIVTKRQNRDGEQVWPWRPAR